MASKENRISKLRSEARQKRKQRIRKRVRGTESRPRLVVFRSNSHTYAQVVDDSKGVTLVSSSSKDLDIAEKGTKAEAARLVGSEIAKKCSSRGIQQVVFDRGGYIYHGRVKALADGAREQGLGF